MASGSARDDRARDSSDPGITVDSGSWHTGWLKVAIALVVAGQGMAFGLAANLSPPQGASYWILHGGLAASAVIVFAMLGWPLARESLGALARGRINVDLLFLITLVGAFSVSVFSTLLHDGPIFYELVAILLAIYTVGKLLGARSRSRALRAIDDLRSGYERCIVLLPDGTRREVRAAEVAVGSRVLVAPGEAVAVDGRVVEGRSFVDTTPLTGEPLPSEFGPGGEVLAGMRALDGSLTIEVLAAGGARRLDGMLSQLEAARLHRSRLQYRADRIAARFVPLVVIASFVTALFWWEREGLVPAVENSLAVLVVACPCALGLATPLGIWSGLVKLGRLGIVARSGDFLDALATATHAMFDKTGTLCEPELRVTRVEMAPGSRWGESELRAALAAAESGIKHPVADALSRAFSGNAFVDTFAFVDARIVPGRGIRARVRAERSGSVHGILAGSSALLEQEGVVGAFEGMRPIENTTDQRRVEVAVDGRLTARIVLDEAPRERMAEVFDSLRDLGLRTEILTGDPHFLGNLWPGLPRFVGMTPEAKAEHVDAARRSGACVLFVGDGLNDAPALAAADASLALRHGPELAHGNALAVVGGESLGTLPEAIAHARRVRAAIRSNLVFAACYNTVGMAIAAAGWLHPVVAALLMAGSSFVVSARVLRV